MALVTDNNIIDTASAASYSTANSPANLAEVSKQAAKALKCVASTSKQVSDMLQRKHERILKRIRSISEEIESLKADVMENITHQRERRQQLGEIEEDVERAQLLGNGAMVEELLEELRVLKEEARREESLYRALCKTVRSRKESKKQFMHERHGVEDEIRTFTAKQKLIQTLLATCAQQGACSDDTLGSSASQSDCGASVLEDDCEPESDDNVSSSGSSSSGSFPENPLDSPMLTPSSPMGATATSTTTRKKVLIKAMSVEPSPPKQALRVRSWSSDCVQPLPPRETTQPRARRSLSVHFASPVLTPAEQSTTVSTHPIHRDLESLDLSHYMDSIDESTASAAVATAVEDLVAEVSSIQDDERKIATLAAPSTEQLQPETSSESTTTTGTKDPSNKSDTAALVQATLLEQHATTTDVTTIAA